MRERARPRRAAPPRTPAAEHRPPAPVGGLAGVSVQRIPTRPPGEQVSGPPVQRQGAAGANDRVNIPSSGGRPLPPAIRQRMESAFGSDFSTVRTFTGDHVPAVGAQAFTRGEQVHFAPGQMNNRNLGHELAHVVQQRQGRVKPTGSVRGVPLNNEPSLEREADRMSERVNR